MSSSPLHLESLLTHPSAFGLTQATPCQRAICRIADGEPLGELGTDPDVQQMIACAPDRMPNTRPKELYLVAAIRGAKSLFAAALGVARALTCDCSPLRDSDVPRVAIMAPKLDLGDVIFKQHLLGTFARKEKLRALMIGNPNFSDRTFLIRHQSGRPIEIAVVATARAGATVVSRWLVALIADEFARMANDEDSVVNFDDTRRAAYKRILPGGQIVGISSPWTPFGPAYDAIEKHHGKPTAEVVALRATGPQLNPFYWTPKLIEETALAPDGERILQTDCWARFADPTASFFTEADVKGAMRETPEVEPYRPACTYYAFMDPATRRNAWTLVVVGSEYADDGAIKVHVALAKQWLPSAKQKLRPREVLLEVKEDLAAYQLNEVGTDQWAADMIEALAELEGLVVSEYTCAGPESYRRWDDLRLGIRTGDLELAPVPELKRDLLALQRVTTREGFAVVMKQTSDGRHADYAPALRGAVYLARQTGAWVHAMRKVEERLERGETIFGDPMPEERAPFEADALHGPLASARERSYRQDEEREASPLAALFGDKTESRSTMRYCAQCRVYNFGACEKHEKATGT